MTTRIAKRAVCTLIAAFLLTASLSGCGNNNVPTQTGNDMTTVQTAALTGKITVYAPDGRQALITWEEHDTYIGNGWHCSPTTFGDPGELYLASPATDRDFVNFANANAFEIAKQTFGFLTGTAFQVNYNYSSSSEWSHVIDMEITCLADVEKEFYRYFAKSSNSTLLYDNYCEKNGSVYARALATGAAGSDFKYSAVKHISDTEVQVVGTESKYELGEGEPYETVTSIFTMVLEDGRWKYRYDG